ncbi:MAG: hypothetical protein QOE20_2459 [Mycobacterium sp.]|nr:hypothetical protein [Mycobacterium sp.]
MITKSLMKKLVAQGRTVDVAETGDPALGPFRQLPGTWTSEGNGWNMIALPLETPPPLDYEQVIHQLVAVDRPQSGQEGPPNAAIHHEPGLFLNMGQPIPDGFDIGRLATIPHGDAALALGKSSTLAPPDESAIPAVDGLPIGVAHNLAGPISRRTSSSRTTRSRATSPQRASPALIPLRRRNSCGWH